MLPSNYYGKREGETHGDAEWIQERIGMIPIAMQKEVSERYAFIYTKLIVDKEAKPRFRANTWLRKTTDKNKCVPDGGYF